MADTIKVKSTLPDNRVALWERHPDHPDGEVFVAGDREVDVAGTRLVQERLKLGWLVEVEAKKSTGKGGKRGDPEE